MGILTSQIYTQLENKNIQIGSDMRKVCQLQAGWTESRIWLPKIHTYYNGKSIKYPEYSQRTHPYITKNNKDPPRAIYTYPQKIIQICQTVFEILPILC
jgi:hypothetical protein